MKKKTGEYVYRDGMSTDKKEEKRKEVEIIFSFSVFPFFFSFICSYPVPYMYSPFSFSILSPFLV